MEENFPSYKNVYSIKKGKNGCLKKRQTLWSAYLSYRHWWPFSEWHRTFLEVSWKILLRWNFLRRPKDSYEGSRWNTIKSSQDSFPNLRWFCNVYQLSQGHSNGWQTIRMSERKRKRMNNDTLVRTNVRTNEQLNQRNTKIHSLAWFALLISAPPVELRVCVKWFYSSFAQWTSSIEMITMESQWQCDW